VLDEIEGGIVLWC